jgi:hypothetical protein
MRVHETLDRPVLEWSNGRRSEFVIRLWGHRCSIHNGEALQADC